MAVTFGEPDLDEVLTLFTTLQKQVQTKDFIVQPSCSLLHTPIDKTEETHLSTEIYLMRWHLQIKN